MMADQLALDALDELDTHESCGRVRWRIKDKRLTVESTCILPPHHRGAHDYVTIERLRDTLDVHVAAGVL